MYFLGHYFSKISQNFSKTAPLAIRRPERWANKSPQKFRQKLRRVQKIVREILMYKSVIHHNHIDVGYAQNGPLCLGRSLSEFVPNFLTP